MKQTVEALTIAYIYKAIDVNDWLSEEIYNLLVVVNITITASNFRRYRSQN